MNVTSDNMSIEPQKFTLSGQTACMMPLSYLRWKGTQLQQLWHDINHPGKVEWRFVEFVANDARDDQP